MPTADGPPVADLARIPLELRGSMDGPAFAEGTPSIPAPRAGVAGEDNERLGREPPKQTRQGSVALALWWRFAFLQQVGHDRWKHTMRESLFSAFVWRQQLHLPTISSGSRKRGVDEW